MKFRANGFEEVEFKRTQNPKLHPPIPIWDLDARLRENIVLPNWDLDEVENNSSARLGLDARVETIVLLTLGPRCEASREKQ
ncbi:hypothetical protein AVEN_102488-1 [Araneus ventricosus]|uniref:Uncharacterized protein n=1 Tax=Araneus ventricosus TaxID=182803 RepID=A0A4Y2QZL6_ARAVE|nr:hypothetical protein AVEN_102488-1 [Araneus ventricosus]